MENLEQTKQFEKTNIEKARELLNGEEEKTVLTNKYYELINKSIELITEDKEKAKEISEEAEKIKERLHALNEEDRNIIGELLEEFED